MNSIEFEVALFEARKNFYQKRKCNPEVGFRPVGGQLGDFCVIAHQGYYHFFGIERRLQECTPFYPGHEIFFFHFSTNDFIEWQVHDPVLLIEPNSWDSAHVWAPHIIKWEGRYVMAYTGVNGHGSQDLGLAFSDDLFNWKRFSQNPIRPTQDCDWAFWRSDVISSCRDPHLLIENDRLYMTYTANTRDGSSCIAMTCTSDMKKWIDHGPIVISPPTGYELNLKPFSSCSSYDWFSVQGCRPKGQMESSNLFRKGDRWFLLVQETRLGSSVNNWIYESDRMDRFDYDSGREFWPGAYTVEFVKECGSKSLLACTGMIRFGEVDWSEEKPMAKFLTTEDQLKFWR